MNAGGQVHQAVEPMKPVETVQTGYRREHREEKTSVRRNWFT